MKSPDGAMHRPSGLAVGPDGSLYVSDDIRGRVYRIVYSGSNAADTAASVTPCPSASASPGKVVVAAAGPPEGTHPDAGAAAAVENLPVPNGATRDEVALGYRIYHGEVGGAPCTGCHGANATGSPLGPDLTSNKWLWGDGSYELDHRDHQRGRAAAQAVPLPDAADGWSSAHSRAGLGGRGLRVGGEPPLIEATQGLRMILI